MTAIISTTYDDTYLFYLPITTWCWNRLGVDVICFMPIEKQQQVSAKNSLIDNTLIKTNAKISIHKFDSPEHKEATYAQCARLYGACLDLPKYEVLIVSDIDMALFKIPQNAGGHMAVFGHDLVPAGQLPMCYLSGDVSEWRRVMRLDGKTYQQCLDELLGDIEAEHFRGNFWSKDQETAYNHILGGNGHAVLLPRARPGTQFASLRYDRDDAYILDRLSPDTIDFHMNRPGYEDANFEIILKIIQYHYPNENLDWMREYQKAYKALL